jgi:hypothetical protein
MRAWFSFQSSLLFQERLDEAIIAYSIVKVPWSLVSACFLHQVRDKIAPFLVPDESVVFVDDAEPDHLVPLAVAVGHGVPAEHVAAFGVYHAHAAFEKQRI